MDTEAIAACLPGCRGFRPLGDDRYEAELAAGCRRDFGRLQGDHRARRQAAAAVVQTARGRKRPARVREGRSPRHAERRRHEDDRGDRCHGGSGRPHRAGWSTPDRGRRTDEHGPVFRLPRRQDRSRCELSVRLAGRRRRPLTLNGYSSVYNPVAVTFSISIFTICCASAGSSGRNSNPVTKHGVPSLRHDGHECRLSAGKMADLSSRAVNWTWCSTLSGNGSTVSVANPPKPISRIRKRAIAFDQAGEQASARRQARRLPAIDLSGGLGGLRLTHASSTRHAGSFRTGGPSRVVRPRPSAR